MKHFSYYFFHTCLFFVFIICSMSLTACRTMRTSEKAVSESETASVTASRLTFYSTLDSLSRQFNLSADSIIMIFPNDSEPEFPTAFPSKIEGCTETPALSPSPSLKPNARKRLRNASRSATASRHSQVPSYLLRPPSPMALKIFGLHIAENSNEKTEAASDLKDSVVVATQSQKLKSASKQSSNPSSAPNYILIIIILTIVVYFVYRLRRFI